MGRPRRNSTSDDTDGTDMMEIDLDLFPEVDPENRPREIVFDVLRPEQRLLIEERGYKVVLLRTLPRVTDEQEKRYFMYLMQGVSEGTIFISKSREMGITFELRSRGYLGDRLLERAGDVKQQRERLESVLDWGDTRHSFSGNTTMLRPEEVQAWARSVREKNFGSLPLKPKRSTKIDDDPDAEIETKAEAKQDD